jgi:hypothetical protein
LGIGIISGLPVIRPQSAASAHGVFNFHDPDVTGEHVLVIVVFRLDDLVAILQWSALWCPVRHFYFKEFSGIERCHIDS